VKGWSLLVILTILKDKIEKKYTNEEKKSESSGLTRQIRSTHQTWNSCYKSAITK
jgi:hypothetical protein